MDEVNLPEGYSLKRVEFTYVYNDEGKIILALPTEHCPPERIQEVIQQTKKARDIINRENERRESMLESARKGGEK
ncbi:MAG: hypothetical protein AAB577_00085 [Patescibacteria group bacterium]